MYLISQKRNGFTLVELSIVLIIIGLLIGGLLVAQSMSGAAKVQKTLGRVKQIEVALDQFTLNFKSFPGDSASFIPPGNGDRIVNNDAGCSGEYARSEARQVFAHLSQAKMYDKKFASYSPIACGGTHSDTYESNNMDLYTQHINVGSKAASVLGSSKIAIDFGNYMGAYNMNLLFYRFDAEMIIPLEEKLGLSDNNGTMVGYKFFWNPGECMSTANGIVSCLASNAAYGRISYNRLKSW